MNKEISVKLKQNWDNVSGISETARQVVETTISENGLTFNGGDRFGKRTDDCITLDRESMLFLAKLINSL